MSRSRKPSVFQIGKVRDDGHTVVISGWGLGLCASAFQDERRSPCGCDTNVELRAFGACFKIM